MARRQQVILSFARDDIFQRIAWYEANGHPAAAAVLRTLLEWAHPRPYRLTHADEDAIAALVAALQRPHGPDAPRR